MLNRLAIYAHHRHFGHPEHGAFDGVHNWPLCDDCNSSDLSGATEPSGAESARDELQHGDVPTDFLAWHHTPERGIKSVQGGGRHPPLSHLGHVLLDQCHGMGFVPGL